jgi:hypothetical protein
VKPSVKLLITCLLISILSHSCKKERVPVIETYEVSNIDGNTASCGGTITDEGTSPVIDRGICWSKGITPTIADRKTIEGSGAGSFNSVMTDLDAASSYYVRAYAKNAVGIGYGMVMSFTSLGGTPKVTITSPTDVTTVSAHLNGIVDANYMSTLVSFEYGTSTSYGQSVPATNTISGNGSKAVNANLSGLAIGTTYHVRIIAFNSFGTVYSNDLEFTTLGAPSTNGLVGYYPFNGNANDQTSNSNHGIVTGATLTQDRFGKSNSAYHFG